VVGWTGQPAAGTAYMTIAAGLAWQGRPKEAEPWIQRAEATVRPEAEPATATLVYSVRGQLELTRGRNAAALAAHQAAERLSEHLTAPHFFTPTRSFLLHALVRLGDAGRAEQALADLGDQDRDRGEIRVAEAVLRLAQDDPRAAVAALAPVLDGSAPLVWRTWLVNAFLLEAIAQEALGDPAAAGRALEHALDIAEPDLILFPFLIYPAPGLLTRHGGECTRHASLIATILSLAPLEHEERRRPSGPGGYGGMESPHERGGLGGAPPQLTKPLSRSETRVLHYLPTNLSAREIARELSVSVNTVRTHMRHVFAKLDAHRRTDAVTRARALGLLAPSPARRSG
jgi:LuxR family transcriptional regulator, maltose regulon positive regulatory protein